LKYFGHVVRAENLAADILRGRINGNRSRGRPKRRWSDDVKDWTGLSIQECITLAKDRAAWIGDPSCRHHWSSTFRNEEEPTTTTTTTTTKSRVMPDAPLVIPMFEKNSILSVMCHAI